MARELQAGSKSRTLGDPAWGRLVGGPWASLEGTRRQDREALSSHAQAATPREGPDAAEGSGQQLPAVYSCGGHTRPTELAGRAAHISALNRREREALNTGPSKAPCWQSAARSPGMGPPVLTLALGPLGLSTSPCKTGTPPLLCPLGASV